MNSTYPFIDLNNDAAILARGAEVVQIEGSALNLLAADLPHDFAAACRLLLEVKGRVVVTGMGKSGHIGRKAAATFSATGTPATYVHPGEASHGDLGMLVPGDVLLVISNSGNTAELRPFLTYAASIGVRTIGIASCTDSLVMVRSDIKLCLPAAREACNANIAPTTSTTLQLALCDALAMAVMDMRGFSQANMKVLHPGGAIGLRLLPVRQIMHEGTSMPLVRAEASMPDVITVMTSSGFGIAGVVDCSNALLGVITDGDLRRNFEVLGHVVAGEVMTPQPKVLDIEMSAEAALELLNDLQITAAFVVDSSKGGLGEWGTPLGVVHIHDFLRIGLN
jgi:arabinose-5-phosphate isomerase